MELEEILKRAKGVKIDSREVENGDIFIGLKGEKTHGSLFAEDALQKGAIFAFVERGWKEKLKPDERIIEVENTLEILWEFAKIKRETKKDLKVIGLTGSVGKTTVKDLIYHFLNRMGRNVIRSKKSYNNFIGVPLTLCEIKENTEYLVCEIGTNKKGEIEKLTNLVKPDAGIITKIGPAHLQFLETLDGVFEEKISFFRGIKNARYLLFNENSYKAEKIKEMFQKVIYFNIENENYDIKNDTVTLIYKGIEFTYHGGGYAFLENLLCAIKCIECEGFDIEELPFILKEFKLPPLRMEKIEKDGITYIYDCYNSNPISMESLLKTYKEVRKRKILVAGDMLELGDYSEKYHREIAHLARECNIELIICMGEHTLHTFEEAKKLGMRAEYYDKIYEVAGKIKEITRKGDIVLIKGSRKMEMERLKELV